jgi:hypothetical protein
MFKVSPASLQPFIDTPNCVLETVFSIARSTFQMYPVLAIFRSSVFFLGLFEYTNHQAHKDFLITLCKWNNIVSTFICVFEVSNFVLVFGVGLGHDTVQPGRNVKTFERKSMFLNLVLFRHAYRW